MLIHPVTWLARYTRIGQTHTKDARGDVCFRVLALDQVPRHDCAQVLHA